MYPSVGERSIVLIVSHENRQGARHQGSELDSGAGDEDY